MDLTHPVTRRRVVRTAATAAWAAPVIVAASAAPAYAGSGAPAVTTSDIEGNRPVGSTSLVDATMTFTNNGNLAATTLSVVVKIRILSGSFTNSISQVAPGWTASTGTPDGNGGWDYTFTRAAGIGTGAANAEVLTFRFPAQGQGTIVVSAPVTSPTGLNAGGLGGYI